MERVARCSRHSSPGVRVHTHDPRALLTSADTDALATTDEMAVVSGVLAFADRPVRELMTPRQRSSRFQKDPDGRSRTRAAAGGV